MHLLTLNFLSEKFDIYFDASALVPGMTAFVATLLGLTLYFSELSY